MVTSFASASAAGWLKVTPRPDPWPRGLEVAPYSNAPLCIMLMPVSNTLATPQHKNQLPEIMMRMDDNTFIEPQDGLRNNCSQPCVRQATTPSKISHKYRKKHFV